MFTAWKEMHGLHPGPSWWWHSVSSRPRLITAPDNGVMTHISLSGNCWVHANCAGDIPAILPSLDVPVKSKLGTKPSLFEHQRFLWSFRTTHEDFNQATHKNFTGLVQCSSWKEFPPRVMAGDPVWGWHWAVATGVQAQGWPALMTDGRVKTEADPGQAPPSPSRSLIRHSIGGWDYQESACSVIPISWNAGTAGMMTVQRPCDEERWPCSEHS